jgi:hypothetical protein
MALGVIVLDDSVSYKGLESSLNKDKSSLVICPNPIIADACRVNFSGFSENLETVTVAKFLNDLFSYYFNDQEIVRKSDLKLLLSVIWKSKFLNEKEMSFDQCFDILTDLRSFTLDSELIDTVLERFSENIAKCVKYFWLVIAGQEIIDEHMAYEMLIEVFSSTDIDNDYLANKEVIFVGFSHLSSNQISLIKMISKRNEVHIPIPERVYNKHQSSDWTYWITTESDSIINKCIEHEKKALDVIYFTKGHLNSGLLNVMDRFELNNIIHTQNDIKESDIIELPDKSTFFRVKSDVVDVLFQKLMNEFIQAYFLDKDSKVQTNTLIEKLELQYDILLKSEKSFQLFAQMKVNVLCRDKINSWRELSELNEEVTLFDMRVLKEVISLDLPRVYEQPILRETPRYLRSLKEVVACNELRNVICAKGGHDLMQSSAGSNYSFDVHEVLKDIGPVRKKSLDIDFALAQLISLMSQGNSLLLLEQGLNEHDATFNELINSFEINNIILEESVVKRDDSSAIGAISEPNPVSKLSATRTQTYLDCPRKYYYSYIEKIGGEPAQLCGIDPRLIGSLEHLIIELVCSSDKDLSDDEFQKLISREINNIFPKEVFLNKALFDEIYSEVFTYTKEVITHLLNLKGVDANIEYNFEIEMTAPNSLGRADLLIKSSVLGNILIDLKRSAGSIPTKSKVEKLKSIQLWYYLNHLDINDISAFGYVNLSSPADSVIFSLDDDTTKLLQDINFLSIEKYEKLKEPLDYYLGEFSNLYKEVLKNVSEGKYLEIDPVDSNTCTFCPGGIICPKQ